MKCLLLSNWKQLNYKRNYTDFRSVNYFFKDELALKRFITVPITKNLPHRHNSCNRII